MRAGKRYEREFFENSISVRVDLRGNSFESREQYCCTGGPTRAVQGVKRRELGTRCRHLGHTATTPQSKKSVTHSQGIRMAKMEDPASAAARWIFAGSASAFPNIDLLDSNVRLSDSFPEPTRGASSMCGILQRSDSHSIPATLLTPADAAATVGLKQQVLIFQYRGKFHAVDHQCPHRSFPLSRGTLYDIEDFGIKLSVGLTCPKHGWAFDVYTGESDRGAYRLRIWDVDVRSADYEGGERQIWVRQKDEQ